jgi:hypothetical protein
MGLHFTGQVAVGVVDTQILHTEVELVVLVAAAVAARIMVTRD